MSSYGYLPSYKPPRTPKIAQAAAGGRNLLGLGGSRSGPFGLGTSSGFAAPSGGHIGPTPPVQPQAGNPGQAQIVNAISRLGLFRGGSPAAATPPTAAGVNNYDLNTDPALQQIQALTGLSDQQAQAEALKERQNLLLQYGDPSIAASVLGEGDPLVQAAGSNPTSTVAQLRQSRDRNLTSLDEQLNQANLGYSGYRVTQEQQAAQDYQNTLAQAAGQLNSGLDSISGNLAAALAANNAQRAAGIGTAAGAAGGTGVDPNASGTAAPAAAQSPGGSPLLSRLAGGFSDAGPTGGGPGGRLAPNSLLLKALNRKLSLPI